MAHFAELDHNNRVIRVLVFQEGETPDRIQGWLAGTWVQTSYNTRGGIHYGLDGRPDGGVPLRKNYAGAGDVYDADRDALIAPQPAAGWILNEDSCHWVPPAPA